MATFIVLSKLTDEGRKSLKQKPQRLKEVNEEIAGMGGKMVEQYALLGEYDFLNILEAPNNSVIARIMVELGSRGTLETTTFTAMPIDEFLAAIRK